MQAEVTGTTEVMFLPLGVMTLQLLSFVPENAPSRSIPTPGHFAKVQLAPYVCAGGRQYVMLEMLNVVSPPPQSVHWPVPDPEYAKLFQPSVLSWP